MKKTIIIILICTVYTSCLFSQDANRNINSNTKHRIKYKLSNEFQELVYSKLFVKEEYNNSRVFCLIENKSDTLILVFSYFSDINSDLGKLAKTSNHIICIKEKLIPIIFYSDFDYSEIMNHEIRGGFSAPDQIIGGYIVIYKGPFIAGKVIKEFWSK